MSTSYSKSGTFSGTNRDVTVEINPVRRLVHGQGFGVFFLILVHPFLALAMRASPLIATTHALLSIALGISLALFGKDVRRASYVAAYVAGAEVLWRMTDAQIFWEAGKYATILILGIAFLRTRSWQNSSLSFLFFLLLCLSIPLTTSALGYSMAARDALSFNLSGPLTLTVCILYFSQISFDEAAVRRLVWWIVLPVLSIATLVLSGILSAERIVFTGESNFVTSGGFGPNQVSAMLGLGSGLLFLLYLRGKNLPARWLSILLAFGLLVLSVLTFSRGGLYNAVIMVSLALVHSLRDARGRRFAILALLVIGLVGGYLIFPRLNTYTGGMLKERFSNLDTTLRAQIAQADLDVWLENPAFGVGPGMAKLARLSFLDSGIAAHTEYTRVLAEHGSAGAIALLILIVIAIQTYSRAPTLQAKTWVIAFLAWPLLEMSHAAMRIVAISFLFGLATIHWAAERPETQPPERPRQDY